MYSGEIIRKLRSLKGITQKEIARKMKISQQAYSKTERQNNVDHIRFNYIIRLLACTEKELEVARRV